MRYRHPPDGFAAARVDSGIKMWSRILVVTLHQLIGPDNRGSFTNRHLFSVGTKLAERLNADALKPAINELIAAGILIP